MAMFAMPVPGRTAEWALEPAVKLRREYNDNIRLTIQPHESTYGSIVTPSFAFGINTPVWQTSGGGEISQRRYSGQEGLDRDDSLMRISTKYLTERSTWQLDAHRTRDSVLTNEYVSSDTSLAQTHRRRDNKQVQPSWTWMFSERTRLQVSHQDADVSYENGSSVGLYDYQYRSTTLTLYNQLSELNQLFLFAGYSTFDVPSTDFDSKTNSLQAGITRSFSATTRGTLQAGTRRTESFTRGGRLIYLPVSTPFGVFLTPIGVTQDERTEKTGIVFSGNIETKHENNRYYMALSRSLDPSGSGGQIEQDTLQISLNRQFTSLFGAHLSANANNVRTVEGNITGNERAYYDIGPGASWQWTREWNLALNYRYSRVKRELESVAAVSHSVNLILAYQPLKWSISR